MIICSHMPRAQRAQLAWWYLPSHLLLRANQLIATPGIERSASSPLTEGSPLPPNGLHEPYIVPIPHAYPH